MRAIELTILTPCYNEEDNVAAVHLTVRKVMQAIGVKYLHLFIDNASTDSTMVRLREICAKDTDVAVIENTRNFGHVRSPFHGLLQAPGAAVVVLAADLQDPPELIIRFVEHWQNGARVVVGQKINSRESWTFFQLRRLYYKLVKRLADVELMENVTGFGLYDRAVIEEFRRLEDPYPYVRGLISELGFSVARVPYEQPKRKRGITKNNFYTLYDVAMLGITSHSKIPLRLAAMLGFALAVLFALCGLAYLVYKLIYWDRFPVGMAPIVIGLFFFASIQLFFIGIIGEYIGAIHTKVSKRPLVIEKERINLDPL
ncbi:MAG TPA: glycosyltransferase family 2 protein [Opitutaceae bacterium]|nr:glycosyltransferase family 2 protein [Opitutaceae bacterium]